MRERHSIKVDSETYRLLQQWSKQEARSVAGHVRWLVTTHVPQEVRDAAASEDKNGSDTLDKR
jgi:hypothetical protein